MLPTQNHKKSVFSTPQMTRKAKKGIKIKKSSVIVVTQLHLLVSIFNYSFFEHRLFILFIVFSYMH